MRRVVSLSFYPQGYEWVDPAPAVVSEGHSGRGRGKQQLPDRFRLVRPGSSLPVEVFLHRTVELGSWLLGAKVGGGGGWVVGWAVRPASVVWQGGSCSHWLGV